MLELTRERGTTYAIRFRAYGQRQSLTLGSRDEGWTLQRAEVELQNTLADVRRGTWRPPVKLTIVEPSEEPTFHVYASEWLAAREAEGLKAKTIRTWKWSLSNHLLPFFAGYRLPEITPREVKRYTQAKLAERNAIEARRAAAKEGERGVERPMSNGSINHTLRHLAQVLEEAVDDALLAVNPAAGKRRRLKAAPPARPWVEPEQLPAFLDSATGTGRLLLGILAGAGLRIGEALALRWQHVDLGTGSLHVLDSKTAKGVREVHLSPALREELTLARAERNPTQADYVIATGTGGRHNPSNLRRDVLFPAVDAANEDTREARHCPHRADDVPRAPT